VYKRQHPDSRGGHFVNAIADAYAEGAEKAGHKVLRIAVSRLEFELLGDARAWAAGAPESLRPAQAAILEADHLVFVYPLWMGSMPALLKGFLEQVSSGGLMIEPAEGGRSWVRKLKGKSARVIVTMGMPAAAYRYYFGAHSLKSFERNVLKFAGVDPVRDTVIGMIEARSPENRARLLKRIGRLGAAAR
jgi:putative NADPH-quinone reductase